MIKVETLLKKHFPFVAFQRNGRRCVVTHITRNDPLGVGGGFIPDLPTIYFKGGGWVVLSDFLKHFSLRHHRRR